MFNLPVVSVLNKLALCNTEAEVHSFSSSLCYFFTSTYQPLTIPPEGPSEWIPHQACSFSLVSLVTNRSLWTADTSITTPDLSVRHTGFNIYFQIPNLTSLSPLPWQQHHGLPHTLLTVSGILKRIPRVTDRVIYHTCHLVRKLWSTSNKGAATCFFPAYSHISLDSLLSPIKHDKRTLQVYVCIVLSAIRHHDFCYHFDSSFWFDFFGLWTCHWWFGLIGVWSLSDVTLKPCTSRCWLPGRFTAENSAN